MRAFWGVYDDGHRITKRKRRVEGNIEKILQNPYNHPFITYVFGKENYEYLTSKGIDGCILINDDPYPYDALTEQYRHKLEALRYGMEEDGFDEMVHLDWDCYPQKPMTDEFWNILGKKETFQANLLMYHRRKATWRPDHMRKIPNGGFVYLRSKEVPQQLIDIWETMQGPSAEPPMARLVDDMMEGVWENDQDFIKNFPDRYWDLFEPEVVNLHKASPYSKERLVSKDIYFIHYQG